MLNRSGVFDVVGELKGKFDSVTDSGDNSGRVKPKTLVPVRLGDANSDGVSSCVGDSEDRE